MESINHLVVAAQAGAVQAYGQLVQATQTFVSWASGKAYPVESSAIWAAIQNAIPQIGIDYGLERLAMLRYGIDDIRKLDVASVA